MERWIADSHDQGREPEPPELAAYQGMTKPGTNPQTGYALDGSTNSPRAKPKRGKPRLRLFLELAVVAFQQALEGQIFVEVRPMKSKR
ncbi:MAG: hypothetical protein MUF81_19900 [Verrucomicrobia bacterium]|nr:hypothetical protein [Verrucomicrobiota bacterium]